MGHFWEDLEKRMEHTAEHMTKRAGEAMEIQKLKSQIRTWEKENNEDLTELGTIVYKQYQEKNGLTEASLGLCDAIQTREKSIREYRRKISELRGRFPCGDCGRVLTQEMQYCPHCGAKITGEMKEKAEDYMEIIREKTEDAVKTFENKTDSMVETLGEKVDSAAKTFENKADSITATLQNRAEHTAKSLGDKVEHAAKTFGDKASSAADTFEEKAESVSDTIQEKAKEAAKRLRGGE